MTNKLTKVVAGIVIPAVASLSGCMSGGVTKISLLEIERDSRTSIGIPKEYIPTVAEKVYGETQIYKQNTITQETVNKAIENNQKTVNKLVDNPIYRHYQNRK